MDSIINTTAINTENTEVAATEKKARKPRTVAPKMAISAAFINLESGLLNGFSAEYGTNRKSKKKVYFLSADGENMAFAAPDTGKALAKQDYAAIKQTLSIIDAAGYPVDVTTL